MRKRISPFLLLCITGGLAIFSSTMAKNPALPLFIRALGVPVSTVGFIAAASTVVGIVVSIPAGILSDIIGRRRVLLTAAVVFATAPFLYLLITAPWELVLVRIYHGLATAILGPVASAAIVDTFEKGRGEKLAWYSSATMVGRFLAPLAGGLLIFGDNFRWVYVADGVAGVLAFLAVIRLPLSTTTTGSAWEAFKRQRGKYGQELAYVFRHGGILATSGIEAVQYFAYGAIETFLPIYLNEKLGYSPWEIGLLFTAQILAATLTKPIMGRLSDKYGRIPLISTGLILGAVTTALLVTFHHYYVLIFLMALFGLGLATVTASTSALVADLSRASGRGGALGVLSSIMDVGQSTGPMVAGVLIAAHSYEFNYVSIGIGMFAVSVIYWLGMQRINIPKAA
ncbi:MAG TPA: MFS transporter [Dehalococcoidales bacterium]|nr:MFS transporter [Dehalococcoidales bacterium]